MTEQLHASESQFQVDVEKWKQALFPDIFTSMSEIIGTPQMEIVQHPEGYYALIWDEAVVPETYITEEFMYLGPHVLQYFPSTQLDNHEYKRPLIVADFRVLGSHLLFFSSIEVAKEFQKKGIATQWYENVFELALAEGIPMVGGFHASLEAIEFFIRRGRFLLEELTDTAYQKVSQVKQLDDSQFIFTLAFTSIDAAQESIRPERLRVTIAEREATAKKMFRIKSVLETARDSLVALQYGQKMKADAATIREILEDFFYLLPEGKQWELTEVDEDDPSLFVQLHALIDALEERVFWIAENTTDEEISRNEQYL